MRLSLTSVLATMLGVVAIAGSLTACDQAGVPAESATAIVLGMHANQPSVNDSYLQDLAWSVVDDHTLTVAVTDEGEPRIATSVDLLQRPSGEDAVTRASRINNERVAFADAMVSAKAATAEVNTLQAITLAGRAIAEVNGPRTIVVLSSMLQTTGAIPLPVTGLGLDPTAAATQLADAGALPDLNGYTVQLLGLGSTAAPQTPLDQTAMTDLTDLWETILERAGATVESGAPMATGSAPVGLPAVSPVPVDAFAVHVAVTEKACTAVLSEAVVRFEPDSAVFADEPAAREAISQLAQQLAPCAGAVHVYGTTSSAGTADGRTRVSSVRAQAVAALLAEKLGVDAAGFDVRGLGYDTGLGQCVVDRSADGAFLEALGAVNRKVIVTVDRAS